MKPETVFLILLVSCASPPVAMCEWEPERIPITDGASIQAALDGHPGRVIFIPSGDYEISNPITVRHDRSGLVGPGRIVQTDPAAQIIVAVNANEVQIRDLILTRAPGTAAKVSGLVVNSCSNVVIENLQVLDNRAPVAAIKADDCANGRIANNVVRNYTSKAVEDRTNIPDSSCAIESICGIGIQLTRCRGMLVQGNCVEELNNVPTLKFKDKYCLVKSSNVHKTSTINSEGVGELGTLPWWYQGSGIYIEGDAATSDRIQVLGNSIENAPRAIDIHSDHVIVALNIITNSPVGVTGRSGSRNVLISGNQFDKCSWRAISMEQSESVQATGALVQKDQALTNTPVSISGASIIANNIISDFGYGDATWMFANDRDCIYVGPGCPLDPSLADVIVTGNIVYDPGRDKILIDGKVTDAPPRYRHALMIAGAANVRVGNNLFHPGSAGVSNISLPNDSTFNPSAAQR